MGGRRGHWVATSLYLKWLTQYRTVPMLDRNDFFTVTLAPSPVSAWFFNNTVVYTSTTQGVPKASTYRGY